MCELCVPECVCVCVCEREREREREKKKKRERGQSFLLCLNDLVCSDLSLP